MKRFFIFFLTICILLFAVRVLLPKPSLLGELSFSQRVYDANHHLVKLTLTDDEKYRLFVPLKQISPQFLEATLLKEDQFYYWHPGINPLALLRASWKTYVEDGRRVGASTITMQVAKLRYHIYSKSIPGKILQIARALQLEIFYSKNEILEAYVNLASYGGNIEGCGAASWIYFGKPIKQVSLNQALTLAVIPQNPIVRTPAKIALPQMRRFFKPGSTVQLQTVRDELLDRWQEEHPSGKHK